MTLRIFGRRYGGSSRVKLDASPFKIVLDRHQDTMNVKMMPRTTMPMTALAAAADAQKVAEQKKASEE